MPTPHCRNQTVFPYASQLGSRTMLSPTNPSPWVVGENPLLALPHLLLCCRRVHPSESCAPRVLCLFVCVFLTSCPCLRFIVGLPLAPSAIQLLAGSLHPSVRFLLLLP